MYRDVPFIKERVFDIKENYKLAVYIFMYAC